MSRRPVDANQSFPALEEQILGRWRERDVFRESVRRRQDAKPWVFYEGPPTANGRPGSHHVLSRAFKDIFPRFQTMRGRLVERKGGWDTHGLPVEIAVEKQLGLSSKAEIEAYGIAEFNQRCRDSVFEFLEDWNALTERIAYWVDLDDAYRTLDPSYVEQVWGAIRQINDKGLLYEGHRVVPYCPRCGTALSSHEVAQGYQDVVDTSAYVRFPVVDPGESALQPGDALLAWTTTPWTLVANAALAVHPELEYVRVRVTGRPRSEAIPKGDAAPGEPEVVVLAKALLDRVIPTTKPGPENALHAPLRLHRAGGLGPPRQHDPARRLRHRRRRHRRRPHRHRLRRGRLRAGHRGRADDPEPRRPRRPLRRADHGLRRPEGQGRRRPARRGPAPLRRPVARQAL
jgi:isoleucyl-tRNA synthetase